MNRTRALVVTLATAVAAVAGVFALGNTVSLGAKARTTSDAQIAQQTAQLDRFEATLRTSLAKQPPALPALPKKARKAKKASSRIRVQAAAPPVRVVYHRPPPIVVVTARAGGQHEAAESEHEGGGEGSGSDD